ncbi:MAG: ATP-binding protein, partial [Chloroflexota bacterium]|nr:ATP-binding protein [Chloroflexota bacterium]
MILRKMVLENFRQFKGRQEIVFAKGGSSRKSPCITVLYGENGRGKTGIYRALMFGLYGESRLSQDEQAKTGELSLVNRHVLELQPEEPVKAVVEIEFTHNDCQYHLHRELVGV